MPFPDIAALNKRFGAAGRIAFRAGAGGLPVAALAGPYGSCEIALQGAHVLDYRPIGHAPVLFLSRKAVFAPGKPVRGGIPICWPWFGKDWPAGQEGTMHGFARRLPWTVQSAEYSAQVTEIRLCLHDDEHTRACWPHAFHLCLRVILDTSLRLELTTRNRDKVPFSITEAMHTYLRVREISQTTVLGLDGVRFFDAMAGQEHPAQKGAVHFHAETDRVYHDANPEIVVNDAGLGRQLTLTKRNSHTTVVWNPWIEKSRRLGDFGEDEYLQMVCVETANAMQAAVKLQPGEEHTMALALRAELRTA